MYFYTNMISPYALFHHCSNIHNYTKKIMGLVALKCFKNYNELLIEGNVFENLDSCQYKFARQNARIILSFTWLINCMIYWYIVDCPAVLEKRCTYWKVTLSIIIYLVSFFSQCWNWNWNVIIIAMFRTSIACHLCTFKLDHF